MTGTFTDSIAAVATSAAASLVFKATLVLAAGLLATAFARRARASVRHALLTSTLAVVLALPAGAALMPALAISVPLAPPAPQVGTAIEVAQPRATSSIPIVGGMQQTDRAAQVSLRTIVVSTWAVGAAMLVGWLARAVWRLRASDAWASPGSRSDPSSTTWPLVPVLHGLLTCSFMKRSRPRSRDHPTRDHRFARDS